jgi:hypothetical protein
MVSRPSSDLDGLVEDRMGPRGWELEWSPSRPLTSYGVDDETRISLKLAQFLWERRATLPVSGGWL